MSTSIAAPYNDKDAPAVTVTPTGIYYRASSLGMCDRRLVAARLSYRATGVPDRMQKVFDRGTNTEALIDDILARAYDIQVVGHQEEVLLTMPFTTPNDLPIYIVGHTDGQAEYDDNWWVVEKKRFGSAFWNTYASFGITVFQSYAYQISIYCHAMDIPRYLYAIYRGDHPGSDDEKLHVDFSNNVPFTLEQIQDRVSYIESLSGLSNIEQVKCDGDYPCPYFYIHDEKPEGVLDPSQLTKARLIVQLSARIAEMNAAKKKVQDSLLSSIEYDDNVRKFRGPNLTVSVVDNPSRLDGTKIRALLKDAELDINDYLTAAEGQHIRVSVPKTKDETP